jgi:FAD/FMN-containing dehydrogenase
MKRRQVLQAGLAIPFSALLSRASSGNSAPRARRSRVRPGEPGWPSPDKWRALGERVGGSLIAAHGLFDSCRSEPEGAECLDARNHIRNPYWIGDQPGGTQVSGWLDAWQPRPSAYTIKARNAADIAAGVNFAHENNLRLVVKGGAHSYLGTSNAPDSLLIWTRAMNSIVHHDKFVGKGCEGRVEPVPAVSAGAGAVWMDLYNAVTTQAGRYVQGGGCTTVGVAGHIQSGGFGSFSNGFGTASAALLEAEVVTADGRVRVVNPRNDPELFWALKGGGGGTFGVITRVTVRTFELPKLFGAAWGKVAAHSDDAYRRLIARTLEFYRDKLFNPHWGEQIKFNPGNTLDLSMVCQGLENDQVNETWQPFFSELKSSADLTVVTPLGCATVAAQRWWRVDGPSMNRDTREGAPEGRSWWKGDQDQVGSFIHGFDSLWLPASLLQGEPRRVLAEALFAASRHKEVQLHFNKGLGGAPEAARAAALETAMNPGSVDAFALAIIADGEPPRYPGFPGLPSVMAVPKSVAEARSDARDIELAAAELRRVAPEAGSYVSESNYFNRSWQTAYFGDHYSRLRKVKATYDPSGLFFVHNGVGSEDWSADGFTRIKG